MVVLGHTNYYPRFGFALIKVRGIDCEFEVPDEIWIVAELKEVALQGRRGVVKYQPEFQGIE